VNLEKNLAWMAQELGKDAKLISGQIEARVFEANLFLGFVNTKQRIMWCR